MEENQNNEHKIINESHHYSTCDRHPFWKALLTGLLTFLGAFCAFYVVSDWHFKRMMHSPFSNMDRMYKKEMREMDKMFKAERNLSRHSAHVIHLEKDGNIYRVLIDLKAFDNNENNVQVGTNGNILNILTKMLKFKRSQKKYKKYVDIC